MGTGGATAQIEQLALSQYRPTEISPEEQRIDRHLTESILVFFANSIAAIAYPPLLLLSFPFILKDTVTIVKQAINEFKNERKFGVTGLIALGVTLLFLQGMWWIFALYNMLYLASEKFLFKTRDTSQRNLADFFGGLPRIAWCEKDGIEIEVPVEDLQLNDRVVVHAGEMIVIDGIIVNGLGTIDQHMLTGEAQPVEKAVDDAVYAGTVVLSGTLKICVQKAGHDTVSGQIVEVLNSTADYRSNVELRGEMVANASVLPTLALSGLALSLLGPVSATALLSCFIGFQLRYTSPLSLLNFLQIATQEGILVKDGRALELLATVDTIVFDKTGTLTLEELSIGNVYTFTEHTATEVLRYAAAAEYKQSHPIALAILQSAQAMQIQVPTVVNATYTTGFGLSVSVKEPSDVAGTITRQVLVGSQKFMQQEQIILEEDVQTIQTASAEKGHSLVYVAIDNHLAGVVELCPTIRPEATEVIQALKARDLSLYIISGDQEQPTAKLAEK
ncbi:MAG: HAD-IC family P-type ATPase, partial [Chloroflexota bacterium]